MKNGLLALLLIAVSAISCGGGSTARVSGDEAVTAEETTTDEGGNLVDIPAEDLGPPDPGAPDPDPGPADEGVVDQGPPDPGMPDLGPPPDPGPPPDSGPTKDAGPQYSETVEACIYVVTGLCDKFIKRCDDMAFNWIPDDWLLACADFLVQQDDLITQACLEIDNLESADPNVTLIKTFGPVALKECVDNFECSFKTLGVIADFIMPLIQGKKLDTAAILALVVNLCFKN